MTRFEKYWHRSTFPRWVRGPAYHAMKATAERAFKAGYKAGRETEELRRMKK